MTKRKAWNRHPDCHPNLFDIVPDFHWSVNAKKGANPWNINGFLNFFALVFDTEQQAAA
jgi:hypothetical protein